MALKVKEVADLVGISVRTLHHYDEIGLLTPEKAYDSGYRLYSDQDLETLQQILFFKALGFPLKNIKKIMDDPSFDREEALKLHQNLLLEKRSQLDQMIATIGKTLKQMKGEIKMTNEEKFSGFDFSRNPYEQEVRERWGDKTVDLSSAKVLNLSDDEKKALGQEMDAIYQKLASLRHESPDSKQVQDAVQEWYDFLNRNFDYHYSLDVFKALGEMHVEDKRFTKNIDKFGDGLAGFMRDAMTIFTNQQQE